MTNQVLHDRPKLQRNTWRHISWRPAQSSPCDSLPDLPINGCWVLPISASLVIPDTKLVMPFKPCSQLTAGVCWLLKCYALTWLGKTFTWVIFMDLIRWSLLHGTNTNHTQYSVLSDKFSHLLWMIMFFWHHNKQNNCYRLWGSNKNDIQTLTLKATEFSGVTGNFCSFTIHAVVDNPFT